MTVVFSDLKNFMASTNELRKTEITPQARYTHTVPQHWRHHQLLTKKRKQLRNEKTTALPLSSTRNLPIVLKSRTSTWNPITSKMNFSTMKSSSRTTGYSRFGIK